MPKIDRDLLITSGVSFLGEGRVWGQILVIYWDVFVTVFCGLDRLILFWSFDEGAGSLRNSWFFV